MEGETVREDTVTTAATQSQSQTGGYYAIRVDARGTPLADSLYDTAEKLVAGELDNARQTLEHLWTIRKETQSESSAAVVDGLIAHFDAKMQLLRTRQETLRKVSESARRLLDEKQRDEGRLGQVKGEIAEAERVIREYTERRDALRTEQNALLAAAQRRVSDLAANEKAVVGALRDVIIARQAPLPEQPAAAGEGGTVALNRGDSGAAAGDQSGRKGGTRRGSHRLAAVPAPQAAQDAPVPASAEPSPFAKSVVKTTTGRVLGEYYYDATVERGSRHYILNSRFLLEQLSLGVEMLRKDYDRENHAELVQMLQDAHARISQSRTLHYEVATQDVVNHESVVEAWQRLRMKDYAKVEEFCERLRDKIETLGPGYRRLLKAQMDRLLGRPVEKA